jgi:hypothetical protein
MIDLSQYWKDNPEAVAVYGTADGCLFPTKAKRDYYAMRNAIAPIDYFKPSKKKQNGTK